MATKINKEKVLSLIEEVNDTGKVSGQAFRAVEKAMKSTDDTEIIEAVLICDPISWIALNKGDLPMETITRAFRNSSIKGRQQALKSQYGASIHREINNEFTFADYAAFIGSKHINLDDHHELMDENWVMNRILFIDSKHLITLDIIMIAKAIIASNLEEMQMKLGTGRTFRGVEDVWKRLLNNPAVDEKVIRKLFGLKDYYLDSALMNHSKTPQDLKSEIKAIMTEHLENK